MVEDLVKNFDLKPDFIDIGWAVCFYLNISAIFLWYVVLKILENAAVIGNGLKIFGIISNSFFENWYDVNFLQMVLKLALLSEIYYQKT